ncbi:MAG: hypothetical protein EZS28_002535 [Streblomastix strix]|uniref:Uncharacterized protein n=1 Tax=Streblomastix strix TaxID=222440 RepID=A0A5J4X5A3_9EUKA|nr:MAG: hypothetical protein EZS28_002535 [Streblomastix strix]
MNSTKSSNDIKYHSQNQSNRFRKKQYNLQNTEYPIPWEKQRRCGQYKENDGAVIAIGGRFGQIAFTCIPLAALMLEQAPIDYNTSTESIQAIITGQTTQTTFHFPPLIQFLTMGREPIELIENNQFIFVRGERTQLMEFNAKYCQIILRSLNADGGIASMAPICVDDDRESRQIRRRRRKRKQRIRLKQMKQENQIMKIQKYLDVQQQNMEIGIEQNNENIQQQIEQQEEISSKSLESNDSQAKYDDYDLKDETGTLLLPTLAWIGGISHTLTYGTIDKRRQINRVVKELPTVPISIAYLPSLHAIAVLLREHSLYPYFVNEVNNDIENKTVEKSRQNSEINDSSIDVQQNEQQYQHQSEFDDIDNENINIEKENQNLRQKKTEIEREDRIRKLRRNYGVEGLGLDMSNLARFCVDRETPFRKIVGEYLKKKLELKRQKQLQSQNGKYQNEQNTEGKILIDLESNICGRQESTLSIRNAIKQMSAPIYDTNGIPFTDLAADHYADKHTMFPRNYRPLHTLPDQSFVNSLCYSPVLYFQLAKL